MTPLDDSTGIAALDELGRRFEAAATRPRVRRSRLRRWPVIVLGGLALAATPALAVSVFSGPERVEDALPQVGQVVDRSNPAATGRALARRGFRVDWILVTDNPNRAAVPPTRSRNVSAPPAGTEIISVTNAQGGLEVSADTRELAIEIAPVGSEIAESHH
jgi:hypothetical protein